MGVEDEISDGPLVLGSLYKSGLHRPAPWLAMASASSELSFNSIQVDNESNHHPDKSTLDLNMSVTYNLYKWRLL